MNRRMALLGCAIALAFPQSSFSETNTVMMQSTFKLSDNGRVGTAFVVRRPHKEAADAGILVTAAHVLKDFSSDSVTISLRRKSKSGKWVRVEMPLKIREKGAPLWTESSTADIAVMRVAYPELVGLAVPGVDWFAEDFVFEQYAISPGLEISCLGYPFGAEGNSIGFPILRSGKIASYPLLPTRETKTFLFDFSVFGGNSGGPVYFEIRNPAVDGTTQIGATVSGLLGVVVQSNDLTEASSLQFEKTERRTPLQLATVIHGALVKDLIATLPD